MTNSADALAPCPFCGSDKAFYNSGIEAVECPNCAANSSGQGPHDSKGIAAWNRRSPSRKATMSEEVRGWLNMADQESALIKAGEEKCSHSEAVVGLAAEVRRLTGESR